MERKHDKDFWDQGSEMAGGTRGGGGGGKAKIYESRGAYKGVSQDLDTRVPKGGGTGMKLPRQTPVEKRAALKRAQAREKVKTEEKPDQPPPPIGHNKPPAEAKAKTNFALPKEAKPATKVEREQQQLDAATARVEEAFKPYEGAKPSVPQEVFPRADVSRQKVDPVIQRAITDPVVKEKMLEAIARGVPLADWYNMEQTRLMWGDVLGNQAAGTHRFNRMQDFMGPTSAQSPVDLNIGNASRWQYHDTTGTLPAETLDATGNKFATPPPAGYGSKGQVGQFKMAMPLLQSGQPQDPIDYLKTSRYGGDLKGNIANVPIDAHGMRAPLMHLGDPQGLATSVKLNKDEPAFNAQNRFAEQGGNLSDVPVTWWKDVPRNAADYYAMEDYYKMLAAESGLAPAQGQAASWVGNAGLTKVKSDPSMTAQQLFNRRVATQALKRNIDPRDLLIKLMSGAGHVEADVSDVPGYSTTG
jgi:hypothetical protein